MPKIVDHDARRAEIVAVARHLIVEGGFRAATMRSLAADAGYANGALKHYFESKDAIIEATFDSVLDEISIQESEAIDDSMSAFDRLRAVMWAPVPTTPQDFSAGRVLLALWDYALDNPRLLDRYRRHLEGWSRYLVSVMQTCVMEGSIRDDVNLAEVADGYISMVMGSAVMHLMYPSGEKVSVYTNFLEDTFRFLSTSPHAVD